MIGDEQQGLLDALNVEYSAIFGYGVISAFAASYRDRMIAEIVAEHRARRDAVITALHGADVDIPPAEPGYTMPFDIVDPVTAAQLGVVLENDCARAWRSSVERSSSEATRRFATEYLSRSAVRAATWRQILELPPSVALPGQ